MKKKTLSAILFLAIVYAAQSAWGGGASTYVEKGYFSVRIPSGWVGEKSAFGLSQEKKKVFGLSFTGAAGTDGVTPRISVHFYAEGNLLHKSPEKFIRTHAKPIFGAAQEGERYGPVKDGKAGRNKAKIFERETFIFMPPNAIEQMRIRLFEKFAVVETKSGFYVLRISSPAERSEADLKDFESVLASFQPVEH